MSRVRRAQLEECRAIAEVQTKSWQETYRGLLPDQWLDNPTATERREAWWRTQFDDNQTPTLFVAVTDKGDVIGFASGGPVRGDYSYDGELYAIYLLKAWHGQGIGRQLFLAVTAELALQYDSMMLWVLDGNPTIRFYERMGGVPFDRKVEARGDIELVEIGYGWQAIGAIATDAA